MEQIVHGSSFSLWHEGEKKRETGRAGWDSMTYRRGEKKTEIIMKTSVSSHHICARFPHSPSYTGGNSLLWGLIKSNKFLVSCHWWDSGHHCAVVGGTKHASIQLHLKANMGKCNVQHTGTHRHAHPLSLFTLATFSCGSTVIIWWYPAVIVRLAPGGGCEAPRLREKAEER